MSTKLSESLERELLAAAPTPTSLPMELDELAARDTPEATLQVFEIVGLPSDYDDGGVEGAVASDFVATGDYERSETYVDAIRRATGWKGEVNKPDKEAIRAKVIEDLVQKGKIAPPPTLKKGAKK